MLATSMTRNAAPCDVGALGSSTIQLRMAQVMALPARIPARVSIGNASPYPLWAAVGVSVAEAG
jgi:hypothetical protein